MTTVARDLILAAILAPVAICGAFWSSKILLKAIKTKFMIARGVVYNYHTQPVRFYFVLFGHIWLMFVWLFMLAAAVWALSKAIA